MRFNALADHQEAHVLDNYTFLEGRRSTTTTFAAELDKYYESHIRKLNPAAFEAFKAQYPAIFESAVAIMQRTVASCTVPSCTACNKAMDKTYEHTMAVYKSFEVTAACESAEMEGRSSKANGARKVIQQIALFFDYFPHDLATWRPKPSRKILRDCTLWRCIAFLNLWCDSGCINQRSRLIAVFYASFYVYTAVCDGMVMRFEEWHTRVWRPFCAAHFESGTFLGYTHLAAVDATVILARLHYVSKTAALHLPYAEPAASLSSVYDEKTLFDFMCAKMGASHGTDRLLRFFTYNFKSIANVTPRLKAALVAANAKLSMRRIATTEAWQRQPPPVAYYYP
jgi:hypothetical protein